MAFLVRCLYLFCLIGISLIFFFWNSHSSHYIQAITLGVWALKKKFFTVAVLSDEVQLSLSLKPSAENVLCLIIWKLTQLSILDLNSWEWIIMNARETPFKYVMFLKYANFKTCIKSKNLDFTRKWISRQCRLQIIHIHILLCQGILYHTFLPKQS